MEQLVPTPPCTFFDQQMNAHFNTIIASCNKLEHTLECTTCIEFHLFRNCYSSSTNQVIVSCISYPHAVVLQLSLLYPNHLHFKGTATGSISHVPHGTPGQASCTPWYT